MPATWRRQCHIGQLSLGGSLGAHILGASPSSLSRPHLHRHLLPFFPFGARDDGGVGGGADGGDSRDDNEPAKRHPRFRIYARTGRYTSRLPSLSAGRFKIGIWPRGATRLNE